MTGRVQTGTREAARAPRLTRLRMPNHELFGLVALLSTACSTSVNDGRSAAAQPVRHDGAVSPPATDGEPTQAAADGPLSVLPPASPTDAPACSVPHCGEFCRLLENGRCEATAGGVTCLAIGEVVDPARNCISQSPFRCAGWPTDSTKAFETIGGEWRPCYEYRSDDGGLQFVLVRDYAFDWKGLLPDGARFTRCEPDAGRTRFFETTALPWCSQ